ncbi:hypothetical protein JMX53_05555 [Cutibacterium avidum]|uniref:hypothetical protein n=1 Tax=Cutibacterium avidum TaxID=33010 RepID=UPI00192C3A0D|nr:hypothetical protein [Cutibacterium avidum]QQY15965.1 hypothetical protein JMX53_05550 [Cutibacterium avidum]QQY15966.1 hypothetical protein JMX53_05555 [Cutibacterium avidum]
MNVEPRYLAADMDNPPLQYEEKGVYGIARMERRMSRDPHHPRAFSLAYLMLPVFLPLTAGLTCGFISMLIDNSDGIRDSFSGWAVAIGALTAAYIPISQGLWLRPGVDHDKVWARFGPFYREIRFADITRLSTGIEHYNIWAGKTKINIGYDRFDYALFYIRLLEELHHRKLRLPDADITDPDWEDHAQQRRNFLAADVWLDHRDFYDTHPQHLAQLNTLIGPPDHYDD